MSNQLHQQEYMGIPVSNGYAPRRGAKAMRIDLDFTVASSFVLDITAVLDLERIDFIQGAYIDNSANAQPVTITSFVTNQIVIVPAYSQGYYTFLSTENARWTCVCANSVKVPIQLLNVPVANQVWFPYGAGAGLNISTGQAVIAVTGTAVQLPANVLSNGLILSAKSTNAADILVGNSTVTNTETGAGNGFILSPGGSASAAVANSNILYVNGTAGDIVSFIGS